MLFDRANAVRRRVYGEMDAGQDHDRAVRRARRWPLRRYPYLVFYVEREDHLDVWRVLHAQRGIPGWMQEPEGP